MQLAAVNGKGVDEEESVTEDGLPKVRRVTGGRGIEEGRKGKEEIEGEGRVALIRERGAKQKGEHWSSSTCSSATTSVDMHLGSRSRRQTWKDFG